MKKLIAFFKGLFVKSEKTSKTYAEVKKEAKEQAEKIVAALDEVKTKETTPKKKVATNPAAIGGTTEAAPKKKKRYYKPKNKA